MRFLANENFPLPSVHLLRQAGHDVVSITEESPGITDDRILVQRRRCSDGLVCARNITANRGGLTNLIEVNSLIPMIRGDIPSARLI